MRRLGSLLAALAVLLLSIVGPAAGAGGHPTIDEVGSRVAADPKDCALNPIKCVKDVGDKVGEVKDDLCDKANLGTVCDKVDDVADGVKNTVSAPLEGLKSSIDALTSALDNIAAFNPKNIAESWAKTGAEAMVWVLDRIQEATKEIAQPSYELSWWGKQYAVTFALGLVVFAFMLLFIGAKIGGRDGPVSGITLGREVIGRLPWVVPMMAIAPAAMIVTQPVLAGFAEAIGKEGNKESGSAADSFIELMSKAPADGGYFTALGGGLMAMLMLFVGAGLGLIVLIELVFASWAASFFGLLVPFAIALWIYPPWRKMLAGLIALLLGLWLIPFAVNLVYWSMWSAAAGIGDDVLKTTLYLLVSMFMLVAAPIMAPMVLRRLTPEYEGPSVGYGSTGRGSSTQSSQSDRYRRLQTQRNPGAGGGGGSGSPAGGSAGGAKPIAGRSLPGGAPGAGTPGGAAGGATGGAPAAGAAGPVAGGGGSAAAGASAAGASSAGASSTAAVGGSAAAGPAAPIVAAAAVAASIGKKMRDEASQSRTRYLRD